jgi:hypothetical protein
MLIKTSFLVAYDYEMLKNSLPCIYNSSDVICLCIDKNRQTWSGNKFDINPSFFQWLKAFDINKKIKIFEDDFYFNNMNAKEMETNQRQKLANYLGVDGWHIQLDVDEYFINFNDFVKKLKRINKKSITVYAKWKTIFKESEDGFFYVNDYQYVPIATNEPNYKLCRITSNERKMNLDYIMLHQSWGRSSDDTFKKLKNWGHKDDFNTDNFFEFWKSVSVYNYKYINNFHPLIPEKWPSLDYLEGKDLEKIMTNIKLYKENNLFISNLNKFMFLITPPIFSRIKFYLKNKFIKQIKK